MNKNLSVKVASTSLKVLLESLDYTYFDTPYVLNIVGVRSKDIHSNGFNDIIIAEYINNDNKRITFYFKATTDPGIKSRVNPVNIKGCAILKEGQYKDCYKIGLHKGKDALVQCKNVTVFRDDNKDDKLDYHNDTTDTGMFGINIHRAGTNSTIVDGWSAGCQVFAKLEDFEQFMKLVNLCDYQPYYTYTLVNEEDYEKLDK